MLDLYVIEQIEKERQQKDEALREQPRIEAPMPMEYQEQAKPDPDEDRGVCIIQIL